MKYYFDSCVYLNIWKEEVDFNKKPLWKSSLELLEKVKDSIIFTSVVLRELAHKTSPEMYAQESQRINESFVHIPLTDTDYSFARKLESKYRYELSFFDLLHIAVCKKENAVLVTRDRKLIQTAFEEGIIAGPPEKFLKFI